MEENRHKEWLDNSRGLVQIDLLLMNDALGLGDLDAELILESARIKINWKKKDNMESHFSGVSSKYEFDENKGVGWRIVSTYKNKIDVETFYRKDLGDSLLDLFKTLNKDIRAEGVDARN